MSDDWSVARSGKISVRLLVDQNLSHKLVPRLAPAFPGITHVRGVNLNRADDLIIWTWAAVNAYVMVSMDGDFHHLVLLKGAPPKVVWLRVGNCSTDDIAHLLTANRDQIAGMVADPEAALLLIDP